MAYSDKVLDHYENPRNVTRNNKKPKNVFTMSMDEFFYNGHTGAKKC